MGGDMGGGDMGDSPADTGGVGGDSAASADEEEKKEDYLENVDYRINLVFNEIKKKIEFWFEKGDISKKYKLTNIDIDNYSSGLNTRMVIEFNSNICYFNIQLMIRIQDAKDEKIRNLYMEIKQYDKDKNLISTQLKNIKIKNITEDFVLNKLNDMQDSLDVYKDTDREAVEQITDKSKDLKDNIF